MVPPKQRMTTAARGTPHDVGPDCQPKLKEPLRPLSVRQGMEVQEGVREAQEVAREAQEVAREAQEVVREALEVVREAPEIKVTQHQLLTLGKI